MCTAVRVSFCCLLGLLAVGEVLGESTFNQLADCYSNYFWNQPIGVKCRDIWTARTCAQNVAISDDDANDLHFQKTILHQMQLVADVCPVASNAGSCLDQEMTNCKETNGYDALNCTSVDNTFVCLSALRDSCNTSTATAKKDAEMGFSVCVGEQASPCSYQDLEDCYNPIKFFMATSDVLYNCSAQAVDLATKCLDHKDSICTYPNNPHLFPRMKSDIHRRFSC